MVAALILAKGKSKRLPGKNKVDFKGIPMWQWNTKRCLTIFSRVFVSSDDDEILQQAKELGAIPIQRTEELCGDTPNILVYQHAIQFMRGVDAIVAVQANSPTINSGLIEKAKMLMQRGTRELMTCDKDYKIYGSIWAMTIEQLNNYGDPYNPKPDVLLVDTSTDIHTQEDLEKALHE